MSNKTIKFYNPEAKCFMGESEIKNYKNVNIDELRLACVPTPLKSGYYIFFRNIESDISQLDGVILSSGFTIGDKKDRYAPKIQIPSPTIIKNLLANEEVIEAIGGAPTDLLWTIKASGETGKGVLYNPKDGSLVRDRRSSKHSILFAAYVTNAKMKKWM